MGDLCPACRKDEGAVPACLQNALLVVKVELDLQVGLAALHELVVRGARCRDLLAVSERLEDFYVLVRIAGARRSDPAADATLAQAVESEGGDEDRVLQDLPGWG